MAATAPLDQAAVRMLSAPVLRGVGGHSRLHKCWPRLIQHRVMPGVHASAI